MKMKYIWIIIQMFIMLQIFGLAMGNIVYTRTCLMGSGILSDEITELVIRNVFGPKSYAMEEVRIESAYGYEMVGTYFPSSIATNNTMILVHGIGDVRWGMLMITKLFLNMEYNVLIYDSRASGETESKDKTFGFYEKHDLQRWVDYIDQQNGSGIIGVYGNSLGGSTALLHAELNEVKKQVSFYIVDSAYSDLKEELRYQVSKTYSVLTDFMVNYGSVVTSIRSGFSYNDVKPIESVRKVNIPIMFIHGGKDNTVPTYMSQELYDAKINGIREIFIAPEAYHLESYKLYPKEYTESVYQFINEAVTEQKK